MSNGEYPGFNAFPPGPWRKTLDAALHAAWDEAPKSVSQELEVVELKVLETWVRGYNPISEYRIKLGQPERP